MSLLSVEDFTDFEFVCGSTVLKMHRVILSQSSYFQDKLSPELHSSSYTVPQSSPALSKAFLLYRYFVYNGREFPEDFFHFSRNTISAKLVPEFLTVTGQEWIDMLVASIQEIKDNSFHKELLEVSVIAVSSVKVTDMDRARLLKVALGRFGKHEALDPSDQGMIELGKEVGKPRMEDIALAFANHRFALGFLIYWYLAHPYCVEPISDKLVEALSDMQLQCQDSALLIDLVAIAPLKPLISKLMERGFSELVNRGNYHHWPSYQSAKDRLA